MTDKRDPRVNPKVGDVLRKGAQWRQISDVGPGIRYMTHGGQERWFPMYVWRDWAKKAEVVNVAE